MVTIGSVTKTDGLSLESEGRHTRRKGRQGDGRASGQEKARVEGGRACEAAALA